MKREQRLMAERTEERRERYQMSGWDLTRLVPADPEANGAGTIAPSSAAVEEMLAQVEESVAAFETLRDELSAKMEPAKLIGAMQQYEDISTQVYRLLAYGSLWFSSDTQSPRRAHLHQPHESALCGIRESNALFQPSGGRGWTTKRQKACCRMPIPTPTFGTFSRICVSPSRTCWKKVQSALSI